MRIDAGVYVDFLERIVGQLIIGDWESLNRGNRLSHLHGKVFPMNWLYPTSRLGFRSTEKVQAFSLAKLVESSLVLLSHMYELGKPEYMDRLLYGGKRIRDADDATRQGFKDRM